MYDIDSRAKEIGNQCRHSYAALLKHGATNPPANCSTDAERTVTEARKPSEFPNGDFPTSSTRPYEPTSLRASKLLPLNRHPKPWNVKLLNAFRDVPRQWFRRNLVGTSGIHAGSPPSGLPTVSAPHGG